MIRKLAAIACLVLAAAGCAKKEETVLRRAAPEAKRGGTITVAVTEPSAIDPAAISSFDTAARLINQTMCDRLIEYDPATGTSVAAVAESWVIANGGRTFTIKLRKEARFSDGSQVTAEDVAYAISRVAAAETAGPVAELLRDVAGYRLFHGDDEDDSGDDLDTMRGVSVIDNFSLQIDLERNNAEFLRLLGHPLATPVPKRPAKADPEAFGAKPVCAGPYKLTKPWGPKDSVIRLVRDPNYYRRNVAYTQGGTGYADVVEFRIFGDARSALEAYKAGQVDVVAAPQLSPAQVRPLGADYVRAPSPVLEYVGLPVNVPPSNNIAFRLALSLALDRTKLVRDVWGDERTPATGIFPPGLGKEFHKPNGACAKAAPAEADVANARKAMAGSGVSTARPLPLRVFFNNEFGNEKLVGAVAAQWRSVFPNLNVQPVPMPWAQYLQTATSPTGFAGPFRMSWAPQYPSPEEYLTPLFASARAGRDNFTRFSNGFVDRALEFDARRAADDAERAESYRAIHDGACVQVPLIPIAFGSTNRLVRAAKLASATGKVSDLSTGEVVLRELYLR